MTIENEKKPTPSPQKRKRPFDEIARLIGDYDDDFPAPAADDNGDMKKGDEK